MVTILKIAKKRVRKIEKLLSSVYLFSQTNLHIWRVKTPSASIQNIFKKKKIKRQLEKKM